MPLEGLSFVFTGMLETMSREECEDLVRSHGAIVRTAISGKTSYLVLVPAYARRDALVGVFSNLSLSSLERRSRGSC